MTLYESLVEAGIPVDNYYSDLYFPWTKKSQEILNKFKLQKSNASLFHNNIDKKLWISVPFAFDPFWSNKAL